MKKIYQEYADLKTEEKDLKLRMQAVNQLIVEDMEAKGQDKLETPFGRFTVKQLSTWKYSDAVDAVKAKLVNLQEKEQKTGVAKETVKPSLTFNAPKYD